MTTTIQQALRLHYPLPACALFWEVADKSGFASGFADAIAIGCWPSRGLDVIGFEIKTYRSDWLRELKQPAKAEAFVRFTDYWWIVEGEAGLVLPDELPKTWGLLTLKGKKLVTTVPAPKLTPEPMTRRFLASLLRSAMESSDLEKARKEGYAEGREAGEKAAKNRAEYQLSIVQHGKEQLEAMIREFEAASGIQVSGWGANKIGAAVKQVLAGHDANDHLKALLPQLERITADVKSALK